MSLEPVDRQDIVALDWRDEGNSRTEILSMIHEKMCELDRGGSIDVQLSETTAKYTVQLRTLDGHAMEVRLRKFVTKRLDTSTQNDLFIARFIRIGFQLAVTIGRQQPWKCCGLQYSAHGTTMDLETVKQFVMTWATTLEVHPYRFGLQFEEKGQFFIPNGYKLIYWTIKNIFTDEADKREKLELTGVQPIPQLMGRMFITRVDKTKRIKAVIVNEHKNLDMVSANVACEADGVVIVMLGGYPTIASREFIKRLSETSVLRNVPFIWVSDHDPDGWTMYKTLKYGSMATPYLSPSLCISRLEWGGITKAQFTNVVSLAKEQKFRELRRQNRDWSPAKAEIEADKWATQRLNVLESECANAITVEQGQRLRNLQRLRGVDDRLDREVQEMLTTKQGVFSCALFTETRTAGLEMLMVDVAKQSVLTPDNLDLFDTITSLPMPHDSDDTRVWNNLNSNDLMESVATAAQQKFI